MLQRDVDVFQALQRHRSNARILSASWQSPQPKDIHQLRVEPPRRYLSFRHASIDYGSWTDSARLALPATIKRDGGELGEFREWLGARSVLQISECNTGSIMLQWVMAATQCQRLLKGRGGGARKFVSKLPTTAINTAIRATKPESLTSQFKTQRTAAPSTTSENGAHVFTHHLLIHICILGASIECAEYYLSWAAVDDPKDLKQLQSFGKKVRSSDHDTILPTRPEPGHW